MYRLVLSERLRAYLSNDLLEENFSKHEGKALDIPADLRPPRQDYLAMHRKKWGFQ